MYRPSKSDSVLIVAQGGVLEVLGREGGSKGILVRVPEEISKGAGI